MFVKEAGDWRQPYQDFLEHKLLPSNRVDALKVQKKSATFFVEGGLLFRKGLNQVPLRCIAGDEVTTVLKEVHSGDCGEHQGGSKLFKKILQLGYYWPTMEADSLTFARKCQACQLVRNQIRAPAIELHSLSNPWPFHTWAFDMVGPINPPSRGFNWILTAT